MRTATNKDPRPAPHGSPFRVAIVGAGAVAERGHLPAMPKLENVQVTLLVDKNPNRLDQLASHFQVQHVATSLDGQYELFDGAIVALPHVLHAPVCIDLLDHHKSVFVEKPMANTVAECEAMVTAAQRANTTLCVGLMRRFLWSHDLAKRFLASGGLGRIFDFNFEEGNIYDWPVASDSLFRKDVSGGGVLIDTGAHTLDSLLDWLGDFSTVDYHDDAEGGIEANCILHLTLKDGIEGTVELSRTRSLRNSAIIRGERGIFEIGLGWNHVRFTPAGLPYTFGGSVIDNAKPDAIQDYVQNIADELENWIWTTQTGQPARADGRSAMASIRLIETCYRNRKALTFPWEHPAVR